MPEPTIEGRDPERRTKIEAANLDRLRRLLVRGPLVNVLPDLEGVLEDPRHPVGGLVGKPPRLGGAATKATDGSRVRVVLLKVDLSDGGRASGTTATLFAEDETTLVDSARVDRRGLVLLRFPQEAGRDLRAIGGAVRLGKAASLVPVEIPDGEQHAVVHALVDPGDATGALGETAGGAADTAATAAEDIGATATALEEAVSALEEAAAALSEAAEESTQAVEDAAEAVESAAEDLSSAASALEAAAAALAAAATALASPVPPDSVVSRLPISFSPALADAVTRLLEVAEGPIPGLESSTQGIAVSRTPLIKGGALQRTIVDDSGRARRFILRVQHEFYFVGFTLGELVRVDPLDPASVTGTLDATLTAQVRAGLAVDAATASKLQAALSGQLSAQAAIDSTLDIAVRARFDSRLSASAQAGIRDDPLNSFSSAGQFFGELGTSILDFALPDIGVDLNANLNASLDVDTHTDLSIRSSLLAAARVNAAASLVNQVRVQVSASLDAAATMRARLVAQINPSLARAVNLLRFVLYDVYAVTTRVQEVTEILEQSVFTPPPGNQLLFPPADVVEYRPFFEPRLLERRLAPHFELLRRALGDLRAGGEPIRRVSFVVEYGATGPGADLAISLAGHRTTVRLRPGTPAASGTIVLTPPIRPDDITEARLTLTRRDETTDFPFPFIPDVVVRGSASVTRLEVRYDGGGDPEDLATFNPGDFAVDADTATSAIAMALDPQPLDFDPATDSLVLHVERNKHYYLGVLAEAAIRVPSLRQDAPQLQGVGVDSPLWRLPLLGFEADRALVLSEADPDDPAVRQLVDDEGTSTIVQLAAAGLYTEAVPGRLQIPEVIGRPHPALEMPQPPLPNIQGLDVLGNAGGLGAPNLVGALAAAAPLVQQPLLPNLAALATLVNAGRPATPTPPGP